MKRMKTVRRWVHVSRATGKPYGLVFNTRVDAERDAACSREEVQIREVTPATRKRGRRKKR